MSFMHYFHYSKVIRMTQHTKKHYWHLSFVVALLMSNALTASNAFKELCWENQLGHAQKVLPERYHKYAETYISIHNSTERSSAAGLLQVIDCFTTGDFKGNRKLSLDLIKKIVLMTLDNYCVILESRATKSFFSQWYKDEYENFKILDCKKYSETDKAFGFLTKITHTLTIQEKNPGNINEITTSFQKFFPNAKQESLNKLDAAIKEHKNDFDTNKWRKFYFQHFSFDMQQVKDNRGRNTSECYIKIINEHNSEIDNIISEFKTFFDYNSEQELLSAEVKSLLLSLESNKTLLSRKLALKISEKLYNKYKNLVDQDVENVRDLQVKIFPQNEEKILEKVQRYKDCYEGPFSHNIIISEEIYSQYKNSLWSQDYCYCKENVPRKQKKLYTSSPYQLGIYEDRNTEKIKKTLDFNNIILKAIIYKSILFIELIDDTFFDGELGIVHYHGTPTPKNHRIEVYDIIPQKKFLTVIKLPMYETYQVNVHRFRLLKVDHNYIYLESRSDIITLKWDHPNVNDLKLTTNEIIPDPIIQNSDPFQQPPDNGQKFFQKLTRMLKNFVIQNKKVFFCAASGITVVLIFWKFLQAHPLNS